ncbi:AAA family ATPase [Kiloniella antarctica]|uniref:AAA family ATPase n=1 Tax=Kiloniella antarctica TaxID=1550907 RepID=A0ABW5BLA9_9PROT
MAKVFLIVGNTGAGKSTYSTQLSERENAIIFSVDAWMKTLFFMDMPDPPSYSWALERTQRCEIQQLSESLKILDKGISVILDIGFFAKSQRARVQDFLTDQGVVFETHFLDVNKATRWERVNHRNQAQTETYQFEVSRENFEFCETIFEPLDDVERTQAVVVSE